jgi:uncharacterized protein YcbK (DUF882 family)
MKKPKYELINPKISTGYRSNELNKYLGIKNTSQDLKGEAIDFVRDESLLEKIWVHPSIKNNK